MTVLLTGTLPPAPVPALLAVSAVARSLVRPGHVVRLHTAEHGDLPAATLYPDHEDGTTALPVVTVVGAWDRLSGTTLAVHRGGRRERRVPTPERATALASQLLPVPA